MNFKVLFRNIILMIIFILVLTFFYFRGFFFGLPKMNREFSNLFSNKDDLRWISWKIKEDDGSVQTNEIKISKKLPKWCAKYERKDIQDLDAWRDGFGQQLMELYLHNNKMHIMGTIEDMCDILSNEAVTEEM